MLVMSTWQEKHYDMLRTVYTQMGLQLLVLPRLWCKRPLRQSQNNYGIHCDQGCSVFSSLVPNIIAEDKNSIGVG